MRRANGFSSSVRRLPTRSRLPRPRGPSPGFALVRWLPLKRTELSDQLDRASLSIALNIAEGAGRSTPRDQARHYAIARGSASECLAVLDLLELETAPPNSRDARVTLLRLTAVLSALVRR